MRSLLFVPGDNARMLAKALASVADAIVIDLEDSVAETGKAAARDLARGFLADALPLADRPRLLVRINALTTEHWRHDLAAVMPAGPEAIMLPKPRSGADVTELSRAIERHEQAAGRQIGATGIVAIATERAASLLAMPSYVGASARLEALAWGTEDLSAELGATSAHDDDGALSSPFRLARDLCLITATAADVDAIDQVYTALRDNGGLEREARAAARDGFRGKMAIHPDQIEIINAAFTPKAGEIAAARDLIHAFAERGDAAGAFEHHGRMVDAPHLARAKRLLARADRMARRT